jgi:hypothetical protein
MASAIDIEIQQRVSYTIRIAYLGSQVEDHVLASYNVTDSGLIPNIGDAQLHLMPA